MKDEKPSYAELQEALKEDNNNAAPVSNCIVWVLAFAPVLGIILAVIISVATGIKISSLWYITLILNIVLSYMDEHHLKNSGHEVEGMGAAWLVPVYLYKRASVLGQRHSYFYIWCILFIWALAANQ
ncbi:MAG: hypothetical protein ACRDFB_10280 [Rhabdochlamydiaceae bacterium]